MFCFGRAFRKRARRRNPAVGIGNSKGRLLRAVSAACVKRRHFPSSDSFHPDAVHEEKVECGTRDAGSDRCVAMTPSVGDSPPPGCAAAYARLTSRARECSPEVSLPANPLPMAWCMGNAGSAIRSNCERFVAWQEPVLMRFQLGNRETASNEEAAAKN
jgi:hypothetical protein